MKVTEERYLRERQCFDLAIRMIGHEARTQTIQSCTRLSEDRIRKLYRNFFKFSASTKVRRHRGKAPRRCEYFVETLATQFEAATLAALFIAGGMLIRKKTPPMREKNLGYGHAFCRVYDRFLDFHPSPRISFDHGWFLLEALLDANELALRSCAICNNWYPHDILGLRPLKCPGCRVLKLG
ncbi:flagellar transcriptional regulator FlhC [bacterium MnTg04]|nr:flagellar transcriptional regulator FlhC [bacterium MnTg04]